MRTAFLLFLTLLQSGRGDYPCLCTYAVDTPIYSGHSTSSSVINHLYEFDCTPTYQPAVNSVPKWQAVVKKHQIGFVELGSFLMQQTCQGDPDPVDTVKVTTGAPTTSSTTASHSSAVTSTNQQKVTNSPTTAGFSSSPVTQTMPASKSSTATLMSTQNSVKPATMSARKSTQQTTTTSSSSSTSSSAIATTTASTTTTATTTTTTTTQKPVTYKPVIATQTHPIGNIHFCPPNVMAAARHNGGYAKVHGNSCYELVPARATWQYAEQNCRHKGGHLVHMSNPDDENFVMQFLSSHNYKLAVWTGLNDINHEENFWWSSGDKFVYAKWMPGRKSNFQHHNYEDCVVLVPYLHAGFLQTYGQWDDVNCKQMYPWICEYDFQPSHGTTLAPVINLLMNLFGK